MKTTSFWKTSRGLQALILLVAVSFSILVEHREHFFEWLPFIILALCPLMHIFMHGGHGHQNEKSHDVAAESAAYELGIEEGKRQKQLRQNDGSEKQRGKV